VTRGDPVAFRNSTPFAQLMVLLRAQRILDWSSGTPPKIVDGEKFANFGFAAFVGAVCEAQWKRRGLFLFAPYGDQTLFAVAEPDIRARFVVSTGSPEHGVTRYYPRPGLRAPRSEHCALCAYFAFNWSVIRREKCPVPDNCAGGRTCAERCATDAWFRAGPLPGDQAAACVGGLGMTIAVPYDVLAPIYEQLAPESEPDLGDAALRDVRNLKMYGFDAYLAALLAAELGGEHYCPNTQLTVPFITAELDAVVFRREPALLAVIETTLTSDEPMPGHEPGSQKPLDRLKTKWLQRIGISEIPEVDLRYIYACVGRFAYPEDQEWKGLFEHLEKRHDPKLRIVQLGDRYPLLDDLHEGKFDATQLRQAFDDFTAQIIAAAKT